VVNDPYGQFRAAVVEDFTRRRSTGAVFAKEASPGGVLESRALGHPAFDDLAIGERRATEMVAVFLDLTNFTGRTFWDDDNEVVDLAHAVLSGFVDVVTRFGGHPLGLRGDGLFAGFTPGDRLATGAMALGACAFALDAVQKEINPWLRGQGIAPIQARAGLDFGRVTFVRSGTPGHSEINVLGFAANFAAKCEKIANSWEIVAGETLVGLFPQQGDFTHHGDSPKEYDRDYERKYYRFYDYRWRDILPLLPTAAQQVNSTPAELISIH
jgi:class 3 adenylate cyclase